MNKITRKKSEEGEILYELTCEDGTVLLCKEWTERKKDKSGIEIEYEHIVLPEGNTTGRTYVRKSYFENKDIYEFETKKIHRENMSFGDWKSKMTDEEKLRYKTLEEEMNKIKETAKSRKVEKLDKNSEEYIIIQIEKLRAKLASL